MENFETTLSQAVKSLNNIRGIFDRKNVEKNLKELEIISSKENFWKDQKLEKTIKQKNFFQDILANFNKSEKDLANIKDLYELALQEKDDETIKDCNKKILNILSEIKKIEINCFLSGKMMITIFILKFMLEQVEQKARIGQICFEECT